MTDFYESNAEWYAALVAPMLPGVDAALAELLPDPLPHPVAVEVGAGVGASLPVLRRLGAQEIFAVEPSAAMRVGLTTRVALDADLAPVTTILPGTLDEVVARTPHRWGGCMILNAIGHLAADELERFFAHVADRLVPGGTLVVGMQASAESTEPGWSDFGEVPLGRHRVRTRGRAEPTGPDEVAWEMEWTLLDAAGEVLDRRTAVSRWRALGPEAVTAMAEDAGLTPSGSHPGQMLYAYRR